MSLENVRKLRDATGAGMGLCKEALDNSGGDLEKAKAYLREKGLAKAAKLEDRETSNGLVAFEENANWAVIVKIACETDFTASNEKFITLSKVIAKKALEADSLDSLKELAKSDIGDFVAACGENVQLTEMQKVAKDGNNVAYYIHQEKEPGLGMKAAMILYKGDNHSVAKDIAMHAVAKQTSYLKGDDIPQDFINKEKEIRKNKMIKEGKPENMIEKIVEGGVEKLKRELSLLEQEFVKDPEFTIKQILEDNAIDILSLARIEL